MIKVIKENEELPKIYRARCNECGTLLEYEKGDTYVPIVEQRSL